MKNYINKFGQEFTLVDAGLRATDKPWHIVHAEVISNGKKLRISQTVDDISKYDSAQKLTGNEKQIAIFEIVQKNFEYNISDFIFTQEKKYKKII